MLQCPFKLAQILIQFLWFFYRLEHTQPNSAYLCPISSFFSSLQAKRKEWELTINDNRKITIANHMVSNEVKSCTVWSPSFSTDVSRSSSGSYVFPVTKGPREAMSFSGLPISSIDELGLLVKRIKGEATTWTFPCFSSSNFTSTQGSAHFGWQ